MVLVNGVFTDAISVNDRGFNYGDGLFTTLLVRGGVPLLWSAHGERLQQGCERLAIELPDLLLLRDEVAQVADGRDRVVKIVITRGSGGRGYGTVGVIGPNRVVSAHPLPAHRLQWRQQGVKLALLQQPLGHQPLLAGLKTLNRLEQVLQRLEVNRSDADEGICVDDQGRLVEATAANLWWRAGGQWFTPTLDRCGVVGVMRQFLLERLTADGYSVSQVAAPASALEGADEIMLTNCTFGLVPVRQYQQRHFECWPETSRLQQQLAEVML